MRRLRTGHFFGAGLIGLSLLLMSSGTGAAQHPFTTGTAVRPLGSGLTSLSGFNWNGIWVKYGGSWAWRPTAQYDWQAMFRCRSGYGSGVGWGFHSPWSWGFHYARGWGFHSPWGWSGGWLHDPYSRWHMASGLGWAWFPSQRYASAWGFWFNGPRYSFGYGGRCDPFGPVFGSSVLLTGWDGGLTMPRPYGGATAFRPDRWDRSEWVDPNREPWTPTMDAPEHPAAFIDPVAGTPTVETRASDTNHRPLIHPIRGIITVSTGDESRPLVDPVRGAGDASADPTPTPSVDPVVHVRKVEPREPRTMERDEGRWERPPEARPAAAEKKPTARSRPTTTPTKPRATPTRSPSTTSRSPASATPKRAPTPRRAAPSRATTPKPRSTGSARPSSTGRSKPVSRARPASPTKGKRN